MRALAILGILLAFLSSIALFAHAASVIVRPRPEAPVVKLDLEPIALLAGAVQAQSGPFDEEGTIVIDGSDGPTKPYILYTAYANGKPSVRTKRLVFPAQYGCTQNNLPCATPTGVPVSADERVRVIGAIDDETVIVSSISRG